MRKIIVGAMVSMDGVMQAPGGPTEDPTKGFKFGGPPLVTQGSTELVHALLANDLVDAMTIFTVPVVLGGGKKLFADDSAPHAYKLTGSRVSSTGIIIRHYQHGGEITIGGTALDAPSEREGITRQERMKREG